MADITKIEDRISIKIRGLRKEAGCQDPEKSGRFRKVLPDERECSQKRTIPCPLGKEGD